MQKFIYFILPLLSFGLSLLSFNAQAATPSRFEKCREVFIQETENQTANLEQRYQKISPADYLISEINRPFVLKAQSISPKKSQKLVILLHGFMGGPDEMRDLGKQLQRRGYNVYSALIPGFGVNADIANEFTHQQWSAWITKEINRASGCFNEIHLAGFSTGGLLIHDYLLKHASENLIKSVSLISPFFKVDGLFNSVVQNSASVVLDKISVNTVYYVLHFPDVQIMTIRRDSYLQQVPIKTSDEIVSLGKINRDRKPAGGRLQVPAVVFITEDDQVAEPTETQELVQRNFQTVTMTFYGKNQRERVPHHLLAKEVSSVAKNVEAKIIQHIEQSWP